MSGTFKVYLTEEKWALACAADEEIAEEVAKQQPEMFSRLNPPAERHTETSPVANKPAGEAIEQIATMRSKDKLQATIDNDPRTTVKEAATKRLAELEGE